MTDDWTPAPIRCAWCSDDPLYQRYHDEEWGVPLHDDKRLFEMLILEGAQAGLSWITILRKRDHYRRAFDGFDAQRIAGYDERKQAALLGDPGIVRNRLKIAATIANARALLALRDETGGFDQWIWQFVDGRHAPERLAQPLRSASIDARVGCDVARPGTPRLQVRRQHDLLCLHAGGRDGERPHHRLLPASCAALIGDARCLLQGQLESEHG